jgi:glycosyltransferase involved in cell wall biosynthesis
MDTVAQPVRPAHAERPVREHPPTKRPATAPVSVLMATYAGESASNLRAALESIRGQTLLPDECVLVADGPLPPELEAVIAEWDARPHATRMTVVRLPENRGLALALNAGLSASRNDHVMRMDSDDIMTADRVATQWEVLARRPEIDVLAAWHMEFEGNPEHVLRLKTVPEHHAEITRILPWRCAVSHPTVVLRKEIVQRVGGYRPRYRYMEDHDLFLRLVAEGGRFHAVQRPLLKVRVSHAQRVRRGGLRYLVNEWRFRAECLAAGTMKPTHFMVGGVIFSGFRILPPRLKSLAYRLVRRPEEQAGTGPV